MSELSATNKGDIGEAAAIAKLCELGYAVAIPFGSPRYDLVAERDGEWTRVQVKADYRTPADVKSVVLNLRAIANKPRRGEVKRIHHKYTKDDLDVVLVWWYATNRWFWIDYRRNPELSGRNSLSIRLADDDRQSNSHMAKDYEAV